MLANEEVTADGRSDIGNFPVFRRTLRQWMLRITAYADRLLDDLDALAWPESIKTMQRNWIGRSDGARIRFPTAAGPIEVFTTRPDTVFGATFVVLAPEHPLVDALLPPIWPADIPQSWRAGPIVPLRRLAGTGKLPLRRPTGSARRAERRMASPLARWPPTRPPASRFRCSSPTTC